VNAPLAHAHTPSWKRPPLSVEPVWPSSAQPIESYLRVSDGERREVRPTGADTVLRCIHVSERVRKT
jgi:hypothetical protein